ncbi:MAG: hypothetical protein JEZ11_00840 [Desulfobacterales bacterium]|nr:hypothetical protein [Desulfobacterales bacterium]
MACHFHLPRTRLKRIVFERKTNPRLLLVLAVVMALAGPASRIWAEETELLQARTRADVFLQAMAPLSIRQIQALTLTWRVHMLGQFNLRIWMNATARLQRNGDRFESTFHLTEPEGRDAWSWILLNFFGKHTQEYRELMEGIEVRLTEGLVLDNGRFVTESLEEFLPGKKRYAGQTAIRIAFFRDPGRIVFWPDKAQPAISKAMPWTDQMGPLTAFFNYLLFLPRQTDIRVVNALKQVMDDPESTGRKKVSYHFESQKARLGTNLTGRHELFPMAIGLEKGNFLDIIYGENIFFQLAQADSGTVKVPHAIRIEGIISKNKKMKRMQALQAADPSRVVGEKEVFADLDEILAARDVRAYLVGHAISTTAGEAPAKTGTRQ